MESERVITVTRRITEASSAAARRNGTLSAEIMQSEEHKAKLRAGQAARRERERQEKAALNADAPPVQKHPPGRPRTRPVEDPNAPKRGRGRPRQTEKEQPA